MEKSILMKKNRMLAFLILFFGLLSSKIVYATQWAKIYEGGPQIASTQPTSDGGYIVAGEQYILKLDGEGSIQWQKILGAGFASSIQQTLDGGYIVAGLTNVGGSPTIPGKSADMLVLKFNPDGSIAWQKAYEPYGGAYNAAYSIKQTSDGGYIVTGDSFFGSSDPHIALFFKLDPNGNIQWQKAYNRGTAFQYTISFQQTSDGGYIIGGDTYSFGSGHVGVLKLDKDGNIQWQKAYGGTGSHGANSVQQTSDGGYIVAGYTSSSSVGINHAWVLRLDKDGNIQWQKAYGGTDNDSANSVQQTSDGGFIVAGSTSSFGAGGDDIWIFRLDKDGNLQWQKTFGSTGQDEATFIEPTSDGGFIVTGYISLNAYVFSS